MSDQTCFTPTDRANAGNSTFECVEYQVLIYPSTDQPPYFSEFDPASKLEAVDYCGLLNAQNIRAAVVEKTTVVTSRVVYGPIDGASRA